MSGSEDRTILCWNVGTGECVNRVRNRLYEGMNITGSTGLTEAQNADALINRSIGTYRPSD